MATFVVLFLFVSGTLCLDCAFPYTDCILEYTQRKSILENWKTLDPVVAVLSTLSIRNDFPYRRFPFQKVIDGELLRSLYLDYSKGTIIQEENYTEAPGYDKCDWAFRIGLYQVQWTLTKLLLDKDPEFLSEIMGYPVLNYTGENQTLNCLNPFPHFSHKNREKLARYIGKINITKLLQGKLENTLNLEISTMDTCITETMRRAETVKTLLVTVIPVCGTVIASLVALFATRKSNNQNPPQEEVPTTTRAMQDVVRTPDRMFSETRDERDKLIDRAVTAYEHPPGSAYDPE